MLIPLALSYLDVAELKVLVQQPENLAIFYPAVRRILVLVLQRVGLVFCQHCHPDVLIIPGLVQFPAWLATGQRNLLKLIYPAVPQPKVLVLLRVRLATEQLGRLR
jgi:hypothetical protein